MTEAQSGNSSFSESQNMSLAELQQQYQKLAAQLEELQKQLHQAQAERNQVLALLENAAQERVLLRSQLEWVLYRLEQINPEQLQSILIQLSEWFNNTQTPTYLSSEIGIDYSVLQNLLAAGNWKKADQQTWELILKASVREEEGWIIVPEWENFPCTDLNTINWLWQHYSQGQFGFSVQEKIWEAANTNYTEFCDQVGWRVRESWLYYEDLTFNLNAPAGHLPVIFWRKRACYGVGKFTAGESIEALMLRLQICAQLFT
jgi:hypothetical protein